MYLSDCVYLAFSLAFKINLPLVYNDNLNYPLWLNSHLRTLTCYYFVEEFLCGPVGICSDHLVTGWMPRTDRLLLISLAMPTPFHLEKAQLLNVYIIGNQKTLCSHISTLNINDRVSYQAVININVFVVPVLLWVPRYCQKLYSMYLPQQSYDKRFYLLWIFIYTHTSININKHTVIFRSKENSSEFHT